MISALLYVTFTSLSHLDLLLMSPTCLLCQGTIFRMPCPWSTMPQPLSHPTTPQRWLIVVHAVHVFCVINCHINFSHKLCSPNTCFYEHTTITNHPSIRATQKTLDKDSSARDAMKICHETPPILAGVIHLSTNTASHLQSPHDDTMPAVAHEALDTFQNFC